MIYFSVLCCVVFPCSLDVVVADAIVKNVPNFDLKLAKEALIKDVSTYFAYTCHKNNIANCWMMNLRCPTIVQTFVLHFAHFFRLFTHPTVVFGPS